MQWKTKKAVKPYKIGLYSSAQTIQTPDRQYGVLTHIDDFKGFLTS